MLKNIRRVIGRVSLIPVLMLVSQPILAQTATTLQVKDAGGNTIPMGAFLIGGKTYYGFAQVDATGTFISSLVPDRIGALTSPDAGSTNGLIRIGNTALGTLNTSIGANTTAVNGTTTAVNTVNTSLTAINGLITSNNTITGTTNTLITQGNGVLTTMNSSLATLAAAAADTSPSVVGPVSSATSVSTNVTAVTTSVLLLAANPARLGCAIVNDSTAIQYIKLSTGATAASFDYVIDGKTTVGGSFECPYGWTGAVYATWGAANGAARVSERTQ